MKTMFEGTVDMDGGVKEFGQKGFRKRELVLCPDKDAKYPQYLPVQLLRDDCDADVGIGDKVKVEVMLTGRKWQKDEHTEPRCFLSAEVTQFRVLERNAFNEDSQADPAASFYDDEPTQF